MIKTRDIIIQLKAVKSERNLSLADIITMIEENGDFVSKSSLSRLFSDGSEDISFKEETILPLCRALLDIENIEETDTTDAAALKAIIRYKGQRISELKQQIERLELDLSREKLKRHEALDAEREMYNRRVDFLKEQVALKDKRMDQLLEAVFVKDSQYNELLKQYLSCPYSKLGKETKHDNTTTG